MPSAPLSRDSQFGAKAKHKVTSRRQLPRDVTSGIPDAVELQSKLLDSLFEQLDVSSCLTVLDVGSAMRETVDFFGQSRCRLHFADLYSERFVRHQQHSGTEIILSKHFRRALHFPPDTKIDLCLFWDFLNYLDQPALAAFNAVLRPFVHKGTLAHAFGVFNSKTTLLNRQYGLAGKDRITVRQRHEEQLVTHQHSLVNLQRQFSGFDVNRSTLLADGRLEMLLHSVS